MHQKIYLSHMITSATPHYGGRSENFNLYKTSSISKGNSANDTRIETTVHLGTHIDMPYHFYDHGQTVEDFPINFWFFNKPLYIEITPNGFVIFEEVIEALKHITQNDFDILIVKTGIKAKRTDRIIWEENYGFSPLLYPYLKLHFPHLRVLGFDSLSVSSWQEREIGKLAHKAFLNPEHPILLLEDMDLSGLSASNKLKEVIVSPLRIENCDGLPCTVYGFINADG
jgi:arylformamidase